MAQTAILIGEAAACRRMTRLLDLMDQRDRPVSLGWVLLRPEAISHTDGPFLGTIEHLEAIAAHRPPGMALVCLPAAMNELIASVRTRLRRMNVPDRFVPTLEDLIQGVGPRSEIDIDVTTLIDRPARHMDEEAVASVIQNKRIAITGAGGSIGGELARLVARFEPSELLLIERSENALFEIDRQIARRHPEVRRRAILHDVVNKAQTLERFQDLQPEVVFHAAAHKHVPMMEDHPQAAVNNNLFGTIAVADAADAVGAQRLVFISTDKAVNPRSIMGASKRLAELYVQHVNTHSEVACSIVRFGNVLGSSGSVLEIWSRQIADGGPVTVTDRRMTRYFMTIPEAASLVVQSAALAGEAGEVFLLDMGEPVKIVELAKRFIERHGLEARISSPREHEVSAPGQDRHMPSRRSGSMPILFTGIRPGEKLHEELAFDAESMRPTRHPDINIWLLPPPSVEFINEMKSALAPHSCGGGSAEAITQTIWRLVAQSTARHAMA